RAGHHVQQLQPSKITTSGTWSSAPSATQHAKPLLPSADPEVLIVLERFIAAPDLELMALTERIPRLTIRFTDRAFWVGPFTEPYTSPCARCVIEHELDSDPQLLTVASQLLGKTPVSETD